MVRLDDKTRRYFVGSPAGLCSLGSGRGVLNSSGLITRGAKKGFGVPHKKPAGEGATPTGYSGTSVDGGQTVQPDNAGNDRRFQSQSATGGIQRTIDPLPDVLVRKRIESKLRCYLCLRVHLGRFCQCHCHESPAPTPKRQGSPGQYGTFNPCNYTGMLRRRRNAENHSAEETEPHIQHPFPYGKLTG